MCGICGYISSQVSREEGLSELKRMADQLALRGPDSKGYWQSDDAVVGLAHRRLSILDLSDEGHQPMVSQHGKLIITFNGEVYNFLEIKNELEKDNKEIKFRGHSDTEVVLAAIERWGLEKALQKFNGMFAFALWNRETHELHLARDRMGEKPLYYGWAGRKFIFASTLNSLRLARGFDAKVNRQALGLYLRHNYVPAPHSMFDGVYKLQPGHIATLIKKDHELHLNTRPYWSLVDAYQANNKVSDDISLSDATDELEILLRNSVAHRMISDVPIGAFLSGGIDSSLVVALMQSISDRSVKTFTIGFSEPEFNEAQHAKTVAEYLGTDHTELYISADQAMDVIPGMASIYDEPFADPSQIPTYLVSKLASDSVKVVLSGDGGDELFYGYRRYVGFEGYWKNSCKYPVEIRRFLAGLINVVPRPVWGMLVRIVHSLGISEKSRLTHISKLYELSDMLTYKDPADMYQWVVAHWKRPEEVISGCHSINMLSSDFSRWPKESCLQEWMTYYDSMYYLPDDILVKLDRASMAVSMEGRIPLLDHKIVEYAASLPMRLKTRNGNGKRPLKNLLGKYLPSNFYEKPKKGFAVPIDSWLKNGLREWAEDLLDEANLGCGGYFDPKIVREKWHQHISGERNWHDQIWIILMFQNWLRHNGL